MHRLLLLLPLSSLLLMAQVYTRGIGVYPGDPKQDFSPSIETDNTYRNLALRRPAYHSSSYDYNLTASLVTDGIKDTGLPRWVSTSTSDAGVLSKLERELILDHNTFSAIPLRGPKAWVQIGVGGGPVPMVDRINVIGRAQVKVDQPEGWLVTVSGSDDAQSWTELGRATGTNRPGGREFKPSIQLTRRAQNRYYRIEFDAPSAVDWRIAELEMWDRYQPVELGGPYHFTSAWMSGGAGDEWVYVDLGAKCTIDRVALYWIRRAAEGLVQVSDDASEWTDIQALPNTTALTDELRLAHPAKARYVRLLLKRSASPEGYLLSEFEVHGRGGPVAKSRPAHDVWTNGRLNLAGGDWRVERGSQVKAGGETISKPLFPGHQWLPATVPGTILTSYVNAGAIQNPDFGDNQLMISDSYFYDGFWYRREFAAPAPAPGKHIWLNFDGIDWKADVFLNGEKLGRIEGGFLRGRFDVTARIHAGQNVLAVRIEKNATPGSIKEKTFQSPGLNGGALGADNPTYHATIGWDWIPPIRGRDTGIWGGVYLTASGPVTIENPLVTTTLPLPDTSRADVAIEATVRNQDSVPVQGTLRGHFGDVAFELPVSLEPSESKTVRLDPTTHAVLRLANPKLWWPAGYGEQNLYAVELKFDTGANAVSDAKTFLAGVREFTYSEDDKTLKIWINGRRFIGRGGNWGFPESMLRYRAREYETAVRYHRDMNMTMIRNWVGQTPDDAFFEACDRNGIVVWQDFWLANPVDGPDPDDPDMFLANARDFIERIRNHPSIGLYCGRNEGSPPKTIDDGLRRLISQLHPDLHYIPDSAAEVVSGHGPYRALTQKAYFKLDRTKMHSEMGMPNIVTLDSLRLMMPQSDFWPQGRMWGLHDFSLQGAQGGESFRGIIANNYGGADNVADWLTLAQFVNYDGYRAMFESHGKNRMGLLLWMTHPAWPSFVWQTYDYYFDPTAAYFGAKKANEPLHIQWNPVTDNVDVVNYSARAAHGVAAHAEVLDLDGSVKWEKTATIDSDEDSTVTALKIDFPSGLTPTHFVRLTLSRDGNPVSSNIYLRGIEDGDYKGIRNLPKVKVEATTHAERQGPRWRLTTELHNASASPALMVRLKAVREKTGDRILPAIYEDNYVTLMPGERRTIHTMLEHADTRGENPRMTIEGFNVEN